MSKQLFIVRHAHRNIGRNRKRDNGLSSTGEAQARNLRKFLVGELDGAEPNMLSSPARRCIETLAPLSKKLKCEINTADFLDEQREGETAKQFERRVSYFVNSWLRSESTPTIICSHGDWIPVCLSQLVGVPIDLKKGGVVEIRLEPAPSKGSGEQVQLRTVLQSLKFAR